MNQWPILQKKRTYAGPRVLNLTYTRFYIYIYGYLFVDLFLYLFISNICIIMYINPILLILTPPHDPKYM